MMEKIKISESRAKELRRELDEIDKKIASAHAEHGDAAREEGGLFKNCASSSISLDIARFTRDKMEILELLSRAEIVKVNLDSKEPIVEVGDVVAVEVSYDEEEPEEMKLLVGAGFRLTGISGISLESPMAKAILGLEVGDRFTLKNIDAHQVSADGIIMGIVKASELTNTKDTKEKGTYTFTKKHS